MIWLLERIDTVLQDAFEWAGEPNQTIVDVYIAKHGQSGPQKHLGVKRWYYLHRDNPRIRLSTLGMPLDDWRGVAKIIVGTVEIIVSFNP